MSDMESIYRLLSTISITEDDRRKINSLSASILDDSHCVNALETMKKYYKLSEFKINFILDFFNYDEYGSCMNTNRISYGKKISYIESMSYDNIINLINVHKIQSVDSGYLHATVESIVNMQKDIRVISEYQQIPFYLLERVYSRLCSVFSSYMYKNSYGRMNNMEEITKSDRFFSSGVYIVITRCIQDATPSMCFTILNGLFAFLRMQDEQRLKQFNNLLK